MRLISRRLGGPLLLALFAYAKQQPLPVAAFAGVPDTNALTIATGQQVVLDGSKSVDPATASAAGLKYEWSFASLPRGSKARIESPSNQITRFTADVPTAPGELYEVQLVVKNDHFVSAPARLSIEALECGANAPSIGTVLAQPASINVDTPVQITASVDDKDNDAACLPQLGNRRQTLKYRWALVAMPTGSKAALRDPAAEQAAFTPDVAGTYLATLVVTDSTGRTSGAPDCGSSPLRGCVNVVVADCGGASPAVSVVGSDPDSPNVGQATQLSANPPLGPSDADNAGLCLAARNGVKQNFTYAWSIVGLPTSSLATLNDPTAANPSFTPDASGTYRLKVVVTDDTGRSSAPAFKDVVVQRCGNATPAPAIQLLPSIAAIGTPVSLVVTANDSDTTCTTETLSYDWSLLTVPAGSSAQISTGHVSGASAVQQQASFVPDAPGDYQFGVTVTDAAGHRGTATAHLTVSPCGNNPPVIDAIAGAPVTPHINQAVQMTPSVSDADSSCANYNFTQRYAWSLVAAPAGSNATLLDPSARVASFVPDLPGTYQAQLVVTDATGRASAPSVFSVTTTACGVAPPQIVSASATNLAPDPGTAVSLFAQVVDPDTLAGCNVQQTVSVAWSIVSRPSSSGAVLLDPLGVVGPPKFIPDVPGWYELAAVATDSSQRRSAPAFVTLTVSACGTAAPAVSVVPASATVAAFHGVRLSALPVDADSRCGLRETFTYAWSVVAAPAASNATLSDPSSAAPLFTPDMGGSWLFAVVATDSEGHASAPAYATVLATACEALPPVTDALAASAASLGVPVTVSAPAASAQGCGVAPTLTYHWTLAGPTGSRAFLDNPDGVAPAFTPDVAGNYRATLVVTDARGISSAPAFIDVPVAPCTTSNLAWAGTPVSASFQEPDGSSATAANAGTRVTLSATVTDPPGCGTASPLPYAYDWALVSRPPSSAATLDSSNAEHPAFVPDMPGEYQVAARVSDALGAVLPTRFVTVSVGTCGFNAPQVSIAAPATTTPSTAQAVSLQVGGLGATSADNTSCPARFGGATFSYAWSVAPAGATLSSTIGSATTFTGATPGSYDVSLVATDSKGRSSAPATIQLAVGPCGSHAPSVQSIALSSGATSVSRPLIGSPVTVSANVTDADIGSTCGDSIASVEWSVVSTPAGAAAIPPASGLTFGFTPSVAGTYRLSATAVDSRGLRSTPYAFDVATATCAPGLPTASASNPTPAIGSPVSLTASLSAAADACVAAPAYAFAWRAVSAPAASTARVSSLSGAAVSFTPDAAGHYAFEVTATDQGGFSSAPALVELNAGTCGNNPPLLSAIAASPGTVDAGDVTTLSASVTDQNASCAAGLTTPYGWTWSLLSRPAGSAATLASSSASAPFVPDVPGSYQLSAQVVDALGNVSAPVFRTVSTTACGANVPTASITPQPVLPATQLAVVAGTPLALTGAVADADNACPTRFHVALASAWSVVAAPIGGDGALTSTSTGSTSFTASVPGTYVVQLVASASNGVSSAPATVSILVTSCGATPPVVTSVSANASRPAVGSHVTLTATAVDPDNQPGGVCGSSPLSQTLSFSWRAVSVPAGASVSTAGATTASFGFDATAAGTYVFDVVATDSAGFSSAPYRVSVPTGACAPGLTGITVTPSATPAVGAAVSLAAQPAVIPDACIANPSFSYAWSVVSAPLSSSAAVVNARSAAPQFTADVAGAYVLQLVVTDSGGFSAVATTTINAGGCGVAPSAVDDLTGRKPAFAASQLVPGLAVSGFGSPQDVAIVHSTLPGTGAPNQNTVVQFYPDVPVQLAANVAGGCGTVSYAWSFASAPAGSIATLNNPASPTPSFMPDLPGEYDVQLTLTDISGLSTTQRFAIAPATSGALLGVSSCGQNAPVPAIAIGSPLALPAPVASLGVATGANVVLLATSTDVDTVPLNAATGAGCGLPQSATYSWSYTARPATSAASIVGASYANASLTPDSAGAYGIRLTATDGVKTAHVDLALTAGAPSADVTTISAAPNPVQAAATTQITVTVRDSSGNPLSAIPVSLNSDGSANTGVPASGTTDATGAVTFPFSSTKAETKRLTATAGGVGIVPSSVRVVAANPTQLALAPATVPSQTANVAITPPLVVTMFDTFGNAYSGSTETVSLALQQSPSGAAFTAGSVTSVTSDLNGAATFNNVAVDTPTSTTLYILRASCSFTTGGSATVDSSAFAVSKPAIAPPTNLVATSGVQQISLAWDQLTSKNLGSYNVYFYDTGTNTRGAKIANVLASSCPSNKSNPCTYTVTGLNDNTQYSFVVTSVTVFGDESATSSNVAAAFTAEPAPTGVTATAQDTGTSIRMTVFWTYGGDASSFKNFIVNESVNGGAFNTAATISSASATSALLPGRAYWTHYAYTVTTQSQFGTGPLLNNTSSPAFSVDAVPNAPTLSLVSATTTSVTSSTVQLSWNAVTQATGYVVYRGTVAGTYTQIGTTTSATTFSDTNAVPSTTYHYAVTATRSTFATAFSNDLPVTTPAPAWVAANGSGTSSIYGARVSAIAVNPATTPATLFAATRGSGVFKSTDNGATWTDFNGSGTGALGSLNVTALIFNTNASNLWAGTSAGVFRSSGSTPAWAAFNTGTLSTPQAINALTFRPTSGTVLAGTASGVFRSSNGTGNWTTQALPSGDAQGILSLVIASNNDQIVYAGGDGSKNNDVFLSTNVGGAFTAIEGSKRVINALAVDPTNDNIVAAATAANGLMYSLNTSIATPVWTSTTSPGTALASVAIDANQRVYAGSATASTTPVSSAAGGVATLTGWTATSAIGASSTADALVSTAGGTVLGAFSTGAYRTTNSGGAFSPLPLAVVTALIVSPTSAANVGAGTLGGNFFISGDGGATWSLSAAFTGKDVLSAAVSGGSAYVGTTAGGDGNNIHRLDTTALTWTDAAASTGDVTAVAMDATATTPTVWVAAVSGTTSTVASAAIGTTTFTTSTATGTPANRINALSVGAAHTLFAGVSNTPGGVFRLASPYSAWAAAGQSGTSVFAVAADPADATEQRQWTGSGTAVSLTTNGGTAYTALYSPGDQLVSLIVDPTASANVYVASALSGFAASSNGTGATPTFAQRNNLLPGTEATALAIAPSAPQTLYLGLHGAGVFKTTTGGQ